MSSQQPSGNQSLHVGITTPQIATAVVLLALLAALGMAAFRNADARDRETAYLQTVESTTTHLMTAQRRAIELADTVDDWINFRADAGTVSNQIAMIESLVSTVKQSDEAAIAELDTSFAQALTGIENLVVSGSHENSALTSYRNDVVRAVRAWLSNYQIHAVAKLRELSSVRATNERNQGVLLLMSLGLSAYLLLWIGLSVASSYRKARALISGEEAKVASARAALAHASDQLSFQAKHDSLTSLPNRTALMERITADLLSVEAVPLTIFFCDLDRFKIVNDSMGHAFGDEILREAGLRLKATVNESDFVGRFGGDEFVAVCLGIEDIDAARRTADRIRRAMAKPFDINGFGAFVGVSIGIARSTADSTANTLLREADVAMYRAKGPVGSHIELFDHDSDPFSERFDTEMALRKAVAESQLVLHWQPIVNLRNSQVHTLEALVRWQRPGSDLLRPADFMQIAEDSGLIIDIGRWVISNACQAASQTEDRAVAVNVSARQLRHVNFVDDLREILRETGLAPERLVLEVTEQTVIDPAVVNQPLQRVRELGVKIALDDFGTGYSSLSLLHRLPVDIVKLDRSFTKDIVTNPANQAIVKSLVQVTSALNMTFIVEGVESDQQRKQLRSLGVQHGQGYWFGQPEPGRLFKAKA